jgi:hypothetical protein
MLALHHGGQVVAQDDLAAGGVLRRDDVDGLVGVHVGKAVLRQLVGKAGADDLGAVQAEHGVHDGVVLVSRHQFFCHGLCLGKAGLLGGDVDVIIDMAVAGGKMTLCHAQEQVAFLGGKLYHVDHRNSTPLQRFRGFPQNTKHRGDCSAAMHLYDLITLLYRKTPLCTRHKTTKKLCPVCGRMPKTGIQKGPHPVAGAGLACFWKITD